jgi:hypothetical protein
MVPTVEEGCPMNVDYDKYAQSYKRGVQERVTDEEVLGAWIFYRTGGFASMPFGFLSPIVGVIIRTVGKKRAGGFPNQFLIAVTPTKVRAFKAKMRRGGAKVGDELAVWDRSGLQISVRDAAINTEVVFESPAEGEKVMCSTGKDAHSRAFLELLQGRETPAAQPA